MKKSFLLIAFLCTLQIIQAQTTESAWNSFKNNDFNKAIEEFNEVIQSNPKASDAYVGLALSKEIIWETDNLFPLVKSFLENTEESDIYLKTLWYDNLTGLAYGQQSKEHLEFINTLLEKENLDGKLKALANSSLGNHYEAINKLSKAKPYYEKLGTIDNWTCVGPFENISASGYNKNYAPIEHPELGYEFTSKFKGPIKWNQIYGPRNDKWVDLEYYFNTSNSIIYSQTFLKSASNQRVRFGLGVSGSVKVWINDKIAFEMEEERNNDIDSYIFEADLTKGYNRVLIQIGESEAGASNFMLRTLDNEGQIINLENTAYYQDYPKNANINAKTLPNDELDYLEKKYEQDPNNFFNVLMLAKAYQYHYLKYESRKTLKHAKSLAPDCAYILFELADVYSRDENRTGLSEIIESLKTEDLMLPTSLNLRFEDAIGNKDYEKAQEILDLMEENYGKDENYYSNAIDLASEKEEYETMINLINTAYSKFKGNREFISQKVLVENEVNQSYSYAISILKKYLKKNYDYSLEETQASLLFKNNLIPKGIEIYENRVKREPYSVGNFNILANIHLQLRNYTQALKYVDKAINLAPTLSTYRELKGKILQEMGSSDEAIVHYKKAIELYPSSFDAREKLNQIRKNKSVFDNFEEVDNYELFKNSPSKEEYPDENSLILNYDNQMVVYDNGTSEQKVTILAKVFNEAGIDIWKEYYIPIASFQNGNVEKIEVLKKDGAKLEAERSGARVVFTNLEAGDAIYIVYTLKNYYTGKLQGHFWTDHYFDLGTPVQRNRFSLFVHKDIDFQYKFSNQGFDPVITDIDDNKLYVWERLSKKAIKSEKYMSRYSDFGEVLYISSFPDWQFISNWYYDLATAKANQEFEVKELVKVLLEDKNDISDFEKAELIYQYIVKNIRYSSVSFRQSGIVPQKAAKVLNTKVGDCKDVSTLFVSMCKEAGIEDVGLVLVNTKDRGRKSLTLPSIEFNHCIARLNLDDKKYFVELTSDNLSFASLGDKVIGASVLEIYDNNSPKTELNSLISENRVPNTINNYTKITIQDPGLLIDMNRKNTGNWASYIRARYKNKDGNKTEKQITSTLANKYNDVLLKDYKFTNLEGFSDTVINNYIFYVDNAISNIASLSFFELPWYNKISSLDFLSDNERYYPIEFWRFADYDNISETLEINLPEGNRFAEIPQNINISCKAATYSITYTKVSSNKLLVKRSLTPKLELVQPNDFEELKEFFKVVVKEDNKSIGYN